MAKRSNTFTRFFEDIIDDTKDLFDDLIDRAKDVEENVKDSVKDAVDDDDKVEGAPSPQDLASLHAHLADLQAKIEQLTALQEAKGATTAKS